MTWQAELFAELRRRLPPSAIAELTGSASTPDALDGWSDLDLHVDLGDQAERVDLFASLDVWAASDVCTESEQVIRVVLRDGRRVDVTVSRGMVEVPNTAVDNEVRFLAALAATKLGRGDQLIGLHLVLELARLGLVQAMLLRDRELGTTIHRFGSAQDVKADQITALLNDHVRVEPRPNVVEQAVELYGRWRSELEPEYRPDWTGLQAVIDRGLAGDSGLRDE